MSDQTDEKALSLFLAAMPFARIRDQLGMRSVQSVEAAITRALKKAQKGKSPDSARQVEIERLDSLYRQLYPLALQGDLKAVDQCLKIGEQRLRLIDAPVKAQSGLLEAYEHTIETLRDQGALDASDEAVIQSGRMIASQIDYATTHGAGQEVTKALYLMPHLMNVLDELGATPEARRRIKEAAGDTKDAPTDPLEAFRLKQFTAGRTA